MLPHGEQLVRQALAAAGCRHTAQRAAVLDYLESVKTHPTAEEVYRAVRRRQPRISLATVQRATGMCSRWSCFQTFFAP